MMNDSMIAGCLVIPLVALVVAFFGSVVFWLIVEHRVQGGEHGSDDD